MKLQAILSAAVIATGLMSFTAYAADNDKAAAPEAQVDKAAKAAKGHNHPCENKGVGCAAEPAKPEKAAPKTKNRHNHECDAKHMNCQDPTK